MVRHARSKKRRAGRIGKVKLKNQSWNRWNPKPKIKDDILRQHWNPSKSPAANLRSMGLAFDPNGEDGRSTAGTAGAGAAEAPAKSRVIELFDVPESDAPSRRSRFPLTAEEEAQMARALARHGTDYEAMFRDVRGAGNPLQHTREKLRRLGARYLLLEPHQRRVEVPEAVRPLLPSA